MRPIYIFDLDGTLANIDHRLHFLDKDRHDSEGKRIGKNYREFYAACVDDEVIQPVVDIYEALGMSGNEVWIWTGRSEEVRDETRAWIFRNLYMFPDDLMMRPAGDHRPDTVLKAEWLAALDEEARQRLVVFEDRSRMVKMYRDAGVTCFQVAEGEF